MTFIAAVWRRFLLARWLVISPLLLAAGCAPLASTVPPAVATSPATLTAQVDTPTLAASTVTAPSASPTLTAAPAATPVALQGLRQALALADEELQAARASTTLQNAQQHAQAAINTLVGAWGRWYDVSRWNDPSDRRGVFPGERVPGPANGTSTDLTPFGWGIRAYDEAGPADQAALQTILGNVKLWRDNPRARYDAIAGAVAGAQPNTSLIARLDGQATRALAWARLIVAQAATPEQARTYAQAAAEETGAALAAMQAMP